jgi:aspartyl-tRNA(Asn)/glutamyl-tRNA(Gln) amidotransferase subunit B
MSIHDAYELVIGLEIHCQLSTHTKIFSSAATDYGAPPNTQVAEVDMGLPGALPVLNRHAVELAIKAGLGTSCHINQWSQFARKNYFYADLPKGYQISQHKHPICTDGWLDISAGDDGAIKRVRIERIHMEEDAGKSNHVSNLLVGEAHEPSTASGLGSLTPRSSRELVVGGPATLVDLNRAGVPLIEVVSHPDMRSADEAVAYMKELHSIVVFLGVCDGNMEEGSFRCDANVSVRKRGALQLGTRCELKNINSFKFIKDAINYEAARQIALIERGERVVQETRLYDAERGQTFTMRSKEDAHDYRYFPEPDLPPLVIDGAWLDAITDAMPELPPARRARYTGELGLSAYDAAILAGERALATYFDEALAAYPKNPKLLANWVLNELLRTVKGEETLETTKARPALLARLVELIDADVISGKIAKTIFEEEVLTTGADPAEAVERRGLRQITDLGAIEALVDQILTQHAAKVAEYRGGKVAMFGFFVGQIMKASGGKVNPQAVNDLLRARLDA